MAQEQDWNGWPSFGLSLGRNLRRLRKARRLTQDDLAELTGLTRNTISNIERNLGNADTPGDPRLSTVYRLARALDVPPAVLLPAGGEMVADICPAGAYGITLRWPADIVLEPFRAEYVDHGTGPRYESVVVDEAREVRQSKRRRGTRAAQGKGTPAVEGGGQGGDDGGDSVTE
ncbi:MAG: helix-turn-helix transcriptional regulator [Corynebacterium humireducens]|jgi:transcriptional regulator with XRE-family HTH domain|uniref:Helix-turn-helix transcriptional regulator n=1 Tax=Corynebacterium humireducens TaxID=1223514 RepID=A0A7X6PMI6_9CORY|nr:helix-turn-helix transcriptional regulator [Corynebacterium humireducens]